MGELILLLTIVLLLMTLGAAILYYRQISKVHNKYGEARDLMGDIMISFDRQLQRQENGVNVVTDRIDMLSSKGEKLMRNINGHERILADIASKVENVSQAEPKILAQVESVEQKIKNAFAVQVRLQQKVLELEKARKRAPLPEPKVEAAIVIRAEKALAPLTDNELSILKILATEGPKTPPEIRDVIKITREHTARLMKKLYEKGYVERDTRKIPYVYRIKEETREILKKARV